MLIFFFFLHTQLGLHHFVLDEEKSPNK